MLKKLVMLILVFAVSGLSVYCQDLEQCFVTNYSSDTYLASPSNWEVTQSREGLILVANFEGPLIFNSRSWFFLQAHAATLSLNSNSLNQVYFGTNTDFNYIAPEDQGQLQLASLSDLLTKEKVRYIWGITPCNNKIFFFSKTHIYEWDGKNLQIIESNQNTFNYNLICSNQSVFLITNTGLVEISDSKQNLIEGTEILRKQNLIDYRQYNSSNQTIITRQGGRFDFDQDSLVSSKKLMLDGYETSIFNLTRLNGDNKLAIATLNNGVIITEDDLTVRYQVNQSNGLMSNSIKGIYVDNSNNLWTANQNGISYIEYGSPWRIIDQGNNISGIISTLSGKSNALYIGTTEGLYVLNGTLKQPDDIQSRVWNTHIIGDTMVILSTDGLYTEVNQQFVKQASDLQYVLKTFEDKFLTFKNNGISIADDQFNIDKHIPIEENTFIDAETDAMGNLFATAKFKGVYMIRDILDESPEVKLYTEQHGLPDVTEIHLIKYNDRVLYTTSEGLYEYKPNNQDSSKFVPFDGALNPAGHIRLAVQDSSGNYYFSIREGRFDRLEMYQSQSNGKFEKIYKPFRRLPDMEITVIYPDKDSILWVAGSEGLFKFDAKIKKDYNLPFNTLVSEVTTNDSLLFGGFYSKEIPGDMVPAITIEQPDDYKFKLPYENNNLTFEYAATFYELSEKTQFSYYLKNNDEDWSKWSTETKKEYTNLSAGDYSFMVKSKNIYDTEGKVATYQFTILPPWYQTMWAYAIFVILAILFIWFVSLAYTFRVRMHRRKLKLIVADRTFEVLSQKKEIESQNNLLKDQYSEISKQKDEIQYKNTELQQSQEEILTINDKLHELNQSLEKKVENRTARIKATLVQLKKANKELDTFVYRASHDLKGPISRIHGLTSLAKLEALDGESKYYDLIENAALDMQGLLSKLSNAYEIMNKEIYIEKIDLPFLLSEIRNTVKFLDKGTKYSFDIQEKLSLETDKYLLKIILENLIENALVFRKKMSPEHEVKIKCSEVQSHFCFHIADTGIGINPEHHEKIFEMFFRGSDQSKGSGLGLYIVKMALDQIHGTIEINSTLFEYSEFIVKIPLKQS